MARIARQKIYFRTRDLFDVEWDIRGLADPAPTIDIERSESPEGPWKTLVTGLPESNHLYRDYYLGFGSLTRRLYYKLTIHDGLETIEGTPFHTGNPPDGVTRRVISLNNKILSRRIGYPCAFFVVRRLGAPCPQCNTHSRPTSSRCEVCYGTGRDGGYYDPIKSMVAKTNQNVSQQMNSQGDVVNKNLQTFWTVNIPYLNAADLMQDPDGTLWKITGEVRRTEKQGHLMRQLFTASSLSRTNIVYDLIVDLDADYSTERYYHVWKNAAGSLVAPPTESS